MPAGTRVVGEERHGRGIIAKMSVVSGHFFSQINIQFYLEAPTTVS
jgi:ABC-type uncharacterized transport system ATPase subunit